MAAVAVALYVLCCAASSDLQRMVCSHHQQLASSLNLCPILRSSSQNGQWKHRIHRIEVDLPYNQILAKLLILPPRAALVPQQATRESPYRASPGGTQQHTSEVEELTCSEQIDAACESCCSANCCPYCRNYERASGLEQALWWCFFPFYCCPILSILCLRFKYICSWLFNAVHMHMTGRETCYAQLKRQLRKLYKRSYKCVEYETHAAKTLRFSSCPV